MVGNAMHLKSQNGWTNQDDDDDDVLLAVSDENKKNSLRNS